MASSLPYNATDQDISPQPATAEAVSPATSVAPPKQYTEMISPKDFRVYRVPEENLKAYRDYGYVESKGAQLDEAQVAENYKSWRQAGQEFLVQALAKAPGAETLYSKVASPEAQRDLVRRTDKYAEENPFKNFLAEAVGPAAEITALAGAAPAAVGSAIAGAGIVGAVGVGAATNAAFGAISRFDDASIHHAFEPAGQEKSAWLAAAEPKDVLIDAALGAALPAATGVAGKVFGWLGKNLKSHGQSNLRDALIRERGKIATAKQGRLGDLYTKMEEVLDNAPRSAPGYIKAKIDKYGQDIETIKRTVGYKTSLSGPEQIGLIQRLNNISGAEDQIQTRIAKFMDEPFTLDAMQKINNKIRESVTWSDYEVNRAQNDKYQEMMQAVRNGMNTILERHDTSFAGTTASDWSSAFKEYSDWQIAREALNRTANARSAKQVAQRIAMNAIGGATIGGLGAAASGQDIVSGIEHGAGFGAGMGIISTVKGEHYAVAAKKLGELFEHADDRLTKATMRGLYGIPAQLHSRQSESVDHDRIQGALGAVNASPEKTFTNIRTHYVNQGYPDTQADDIARRQFAMLTDIAALQPQRAIAQDLPTRTLGDPMQRRKVQELYRVATDPTHAVTNPTKENIAFLQKHYPNIAFNAQQAVVQQLQQNPDLPYAAKRYASRIMGRPVSNSTSPQFSMMIAQARAQMAQAEQQGAQSGGPARQKKVQSGPGADVNTRFDRLQGGD